MVEYEKFLKPPIVEAVIDIRVLLSNDTSVSVFDSLYEKIKNKYPNRGEKYCVNSQFQLTRDREPDISSFQSKTGIEGYLFRDNEGSKIFQARINGFTFNKLKPYQNWETFVEEGQNLWALYSEIAKPQKIFRIGLRYINQIDIPLAFNDFGEYILTNPQIAPNLPQGISSFFMRLNIPNPEIGAMAIINQTIESPPVNDRLGLIFDIDVFKEEEYSKRIDKMWEDFNLLKSFENDIFFKSITKKTRELFL